MKQTNLSMCLTDVSRFVKAKYPFRKFIGNCFLNTVRHIFNYIFLLYGLNDEFPLFLIFLHRQTYLLVFYNMQVKLETVQQSILLFYMTPVVPYRKFEQFLSKYFTRLAFMHNNLMK